MSPLTIFVVLSTLGCDFLLVCLFQWVYGEKRRLRQIRSLRKKEAEANNAKIRLMPPTSAASPRRPSTSLRVLPAPSARAICSSSDSRGVSGADALASVTVLSAQALPGP